MGVYTYARYSTDRQTEASIVDQQRRCHDYARSRDLSVGADFTDQGISGAALGNRPGFQAALATLKSGDTLLAADLTRLSRSQELAPLLDRLRFRGIRVIGVLDGFDSDAPQARMQAGLSGLMSDELRAGIRTRTHSALQMRAAMGRPTGGKVYGFDAAGEVMPRQAAVVLEIFTRFSLGETMKSIVRDLNLRRIPSPGATWKRIGRRRDGCWLISTLHPMLRNERYIGRVVWNKTMWLKDPDSGRRLRRARPDTDWVITACTPLVEQGTWDAVQQRFRERVGSGSRSGRPRRYLLSGLLTCERCGARLVVTSKPPRYACGTFLYGGAAACPVSATARLENVESAILEPVRSMLLSDEAVETFCREIRQLHIQDESEPDHAWSAAEQSLAEELEDLESLIKTRPARGATLAPVIEELRQKQSSLRRAAARRSEPRDALDLPAEREYRAAVADINRALRGGSVEAARGALRGLIGEIPVFQTGKTLAARLTMRPGGLFRNPASVLLVGSGGRI